MLVRVHPTLRKRLKGIEEVYKQKVWRKEMDFWLQEDKMTQINATLPLSSVDVSKLSDNDLLAHFHKCYTHVSTPFLTDLTELSLVGRNDPSTPRVHLHIGDFLSHLNKWGIDLIEGMQLLSGLSAISYG